MAKFRCEVTWDNGLRWVTTVTRADGDRAAARADAEDAAVRNFGFWIASKNPERPWDKSWDHRFGIRSVRSYAIGSKVKK